MVYSAATTGVDGSRTFNLDLDKVAHTHTHTHTRARARRYCAVVANFYAFTTAAAAGELAPRTPDSVRQSAEQLLEALRGEAAAQRRSLERDEALHGDLRLGGGARRPGRRAPSHLGSG